MCVRAYGTGRGRVGGTCGTGHVEEPEVFRPGEGDEQSGAHPQLKPLRGGTRAHSRACARSACGRRVGLLFCRFVGGVRTV